MLYNKQQQTDRQIRSVTLLCILSNFVLAGFKLLVGILASSIALIADGIHSFSDMVTDLVILIGIQFSSKQPDEHHPYGHGRIETFAAIIIAAVLLISGAAMIYYAAVQIAKAKIVKPHFAVLVAAVLSIFVKEILYRRTKAVALRTHSTALYANAWHHRSDVLSSIAVLVGFISMKVGFDFGDQIAAIAVGVMITTVSARILSDCFKEFAESAIDANILERIKKIIDANPDIADWHNLRTRMVGREIFLDLHILVVPDLTIEVGHNISTSLENTLQTQLSQPVNVIVHVEPDIPSERK